MKDNLKRAGYALEALKFYSKGKYSENEIQMRGEGVETRAGDLIADLLHLVAMEPDADPHRCLNMAESNFLQEQEEDTEGELE